MIKTYKIQNDTPEFQTITLPKGTALFRGIDAEATAAATDIFADLIGTHIPAQTRCIAPTANTFFYPAPYVSNCIQPFSTHIIYLTNYPLELLLLIAPSKNTRISTPTPLITICSNISQYDKCGRKHPDYDPCLTEKAITLFPNISGYIAIAESDAYSFMEQYRQYMAQGKRIELSQMMTCISSNSRGLVSVPEIVIHPLHLKRDAKDPFRIPLHALRTPENTVRYCINNRTQYNYFPLLYITTEQVYTFTDLSYNGAIERIKSLRAEYALTRSPLLKILKGIMNRLLSPEGYTINGTTFHLSIDMRTGFYVFQDIAEPKQQKPQEYKMGKLHISDPVNDSNYIVPYSYFLADKHKLMKFISQGEYAETGEIERSLNSRGFSMSPKYILQKGNTYKGIYKVDKVLNREDLKPKSVQAKEESRAKNKLADDILMKYLGL